MKLVIADTETMKDLIEIVSNILTEANLRVSKDRIEIMGIDPSNVLKVEMTMESGMFIEYDVKKDQVIGLNLNNIKTILKNFGKDAILSIEAKDDKAATIQISAVEDYEASVTLPVIDDIKDERKPINLNPDIEFWMRTKDFSKAVDIIGIVSESIIFESSKENRGKSVSIKGKGDLSKADIHGFVDMKVNPLNKNTKDIRSKYSTDFLTKITKANKLKDMVKLEIGTDYPLWVTYSAADKYEIAFILAPRVDND